jgi:hypothetical protein
MGDIPEVDQPESVTPPTEKLGSSSTEATDAGRWLASALEVLERTSAKLLLRVPPSTPRK